MPAPGGFQPTEVQSGVDPNMFTLIDPDAIPYPLTDSWSLDYAAETLRSRGEDLSDGAGDLRSTWQGLQAHYTAPESDDLFSKMDPVVTRGEGVQEDLATVAGALEDLAEAAATARRALNTLKIQAQGFYNRNHDKPVWWLTKDDETDEAALKENIRLKDGVNTAWAAFNEAENACATTISGVYGGAAYASPDQARGDDVIVYGLPADAGERDLSLETTFGFEGINGFANDITGWAGSEFHPSLANFDSSSGQAAWNILVVDGLWGAAVGAQSLLGFWHPDNGWRFDPEGRRENAKAGWNDARLGAATMVGLYDGEDWLFDPEQKDLPYRGASWDEWRSNMEAVLGDAVEGHTAWSQREDDPEYTGATTTINAALLTVGLPIKVLKTGLTLGPDGDFGNHGGTDRSDFPQGDRPSPTGGRPLSGEHSPWPREGDTWGAQTEERFGHDLGVLRESLLDPNRYREPSTPQPDRPATGGDGAPAPRDQESGATVDRSEAPVTDHPRGDGRRDDDADAPRSGNDSDPVTADRRDPGTTEDVRSPDRDSDREDGQNPRERPESPDPYAGGGGGDDRPPRDRTSTGGDGDGDGDGDGGENRDESQQGIEPELTPEFENARELNRKLVQGGLSQEQIDALRGDMPLEHPDWQRIFTAMHDAFSKNLTPQLNPPAVEFSFQGARSPKEFAYRYEYFTSTYLEEARRLREVEGFGKKNSKTEAANRILSERIDFQDRLDQDHETVRSVHQNHAPTFIDPHPLEIENSLRERSGEIHMGHETSAAYHARKHPEAVPPGERTGSPVLDYLNSAARTLNEGDIVSRVVTESGSERIIVTRPFFNSDGAQPKNHRGAPQVLQAILYIKPDSSIVLATYDVK